MKRTWTAVLVASVIVIIGVAVWAATRHTNTSKKTNSSSNTSNMANQPSPPPASSGSSSSSTAMPANATITYTDNGFSPSSVGVKSGGQLTVKNSASDAVQFDSDPHPVHTDDTDLNVGVVSPGSSKTVTVIKKGTFGVHNHLDPTEKATVVIE